MRSRLAVILVADVVGYSRRMAEDEAKTIASVRDLGQRHLEPGVASHGGEILKRMGDGFILAFGSIHEAISCAVEMQEALAKEPGIQIRIGGHLGEIVEEEEDFYGAGVNIASRLQSEAPPGGVMVSQDLYRQLTGSRARQFTSAGNFELKNIPFPVEGFQWRPIVDPGGRAGGELPSIAVDEFQFAPDSADAHMLAEDLRDQVLQLLSRRTGIRTIDTVIQGDKDSTYRIRGRVRLAGERARMTLTVLDCGNGEAVFAHNYEGDASEVLEFADSTVRKVNSDLRVMLNAYDGERLSDLPDDALSISELRARAANCFYGATYESWLRAQSLLERALVMTPDDPMSLGMYAMADLNTTMARYDLLPAKKIEHHEERLNFAISRMPKSDFLFATRCIIRARGRRDALAARADARAALDLNPGYVVAIDAMANVEMLEGDFDSAIQRINRSNPHDRLDGVRMWKLAVCQFLGGQPDEAAITAAEFLSNWHHIGAMHRLHGMALKEVGDTEGAAKAEAAAERVGLKPEIITLRPTLPDAQTDFVERFRPTSGL